MYKPITYSTNLLTEETDSFVNRLDPSRVFKSKNKILVPKKKGPVQPASGQKGPSGPPSTSKASSGSGNPVRKWVPLPPAPCKPHSDDLHADSPGMAQASDSVCGSAGLLPSDQNPRPFTLISISQELGGPAQVFPKALLAYPHSRLCHPLPLEAVENFRSYLRDQIDLLRGFLFSAAALYPSTVIREVLPKKLQFETMRHSHHHRKFCSTALH